MTAKWALDRFGGCHVGAAGSGATTWAAVAQSSSQHQVITTHLNSIDAFDIRGRPMMTQLALMGDFEDLAGFGELLTPAVVRVRGPSAFCEATPCRVGHYMTIAPPLFSAIAFVEAAVAEYCAARGLGQKSYSCVDVDKSHAKRGAHAALATAAIRLSTRIIAGSNTGVKQYVDASSRRAAKLEFQTAVTALATWVENNI